MRWGAALDKPGCSAHPVFVHSDEGCEQQLSVYVNVSDKYKGGLAQGRIVNGHGVQPRRPRLPEGGARLHRRKLPRRAARQAGRSEEHTSELQSLMRISYAV